MLISFESIDSPEASFITTEAAFNAKPKRRRYPVRCYDNGGKTFDRYTVIYTKLNTNGRNSWYDYIGMSEQPFAPQGFGQHGEVKYLPTDQEWKEVGKRIPFRALPPDCQKCVLQDLEQDKKPETK